MTRAASSEKSRGDTQAVWMQLYVYLFTDKDLATYRQYPKLFDSLPIEERLRHYVLGDYSELRFFRHSDARAWVPGGDLHPIYPLRIRMKHFAYRSPEQIRKRLETRREPMLRGEFLHEKRANWVMNGRIVPRPRASERPAAILGGADQAQFPVSFRSPGWTLREEDSAWRASSASRWTVRLASHARSLLRRVRYGRIGVRIPYRATNEIAT
jgi:hypothetical protein